MKPSILLVDDEPAVLNALSRLLRTQPYHILTAEDAPRALEILRRETVQVIISDEDMPYMNGTEFLTVVAQKHPATVRIMLTGKINLQVALEAINKGEIFRLLTKPCSEVDLTTAIQQAVAHYNQLRR